MTVPSREPTPESTANPESPAPAGERRQRGARNRVRRWFIDMLGRLHRWAEAGWAPHATALWGVMQGSVFPGPADALLVPLGIADPPRVGRLAVAALLGTTVGGMISYGIGAFAFEEVGRPLLHLFGIEDTTIAASERLFDRRGWLIVATAAITPIPMKLVCMASGAFGVPVIPFFLALVGGRGARFAAIALAVRLAGERIGRWAARYRGDRAARRAA